MAVLASKRTSMVVEKRNASSFRDVEIAVVLQVYCACMGLGGGGGMGDVGIRFQVGFLRWVW